MPDAEPTILLETNSPNGNIAAIVEANGDTIYFYLFGSKEIELGIRSCWVRNLIAAPKLLDQEAMAERGEPPLMPANCCSHPQGAPIPTPDQLSVVWFEQGDGAALLEDNQILAIIPAWSGSKGFHGFARDCIAESPLAWQLGNRNTNVLFARVDKACEYWQTWDENPWPSYRDQQVKAYESILGRHDKYYAIDGGDWPPKALLRFDRTDAIIFATAGVSLRPMPQVEMNFEDPSPVQRVELCLAIHPQLADETARRLLGQYISGQSGLPWRHYTFFGEGHTLPCDCIPTGATGIAFSSILFIRDPRLTPKIALPNYRGDLVTTLWMIPITPKELSIAKEFGSAKVVDMLLAANCGFVHRDRPNLA